MPPPLIFGIPARLTHLIVELLYFILILGFCLATYFKTKEIEEYCDKEIFGWIRKPFSTDDLKEYIDGVAISDTGKKAS